LFNPEDNRDYIKAPTVLHMNDLQVQATATAALHCCSPGLSPGISSDLTKLSTRVISSSVPHMVVLVILLDVNFSLFSLYPASLVELITTVPSCPLTGK
jgi:hypothetical protein